MCGRRHSKKTCQHDLSIVGEGFYCEEEKENIQRQLEESRAERVKRETDWTWPGQRKPESGRKEWREQELVTEQEKV